MKKSYFEIFLLLFLLSCTPNDNNTGSENAITSRVKKQVMNIAINYAREKFKDSKKTIEENGIIIIGDTRIKYAIDPSIIVVGLIDDDANEDAIVSISSYNGQYLPITEHLILIKTNGKFKLTRVIESDMKIIGIKDRVISVEISKIARDSPLYGCQECKEIIKYQYKDGDLVRME